MAKQFVSQFARLGIRIGTKRYQFLGHRLAMKNDFSDDDQTALLNDPRYRIDYCLLEDFSDLHPECRALKIYKDSLKEKAKNQNQVRSENKQLKEELKNLKAKKEKTNTEKTKMEPSKTDPDNEQKAKSQKAKYQKH